MISALKVINDHLEKYPEPIESQIRSARDIAASEWFRISSTEKANPDDVEDYLDNFEELSWDLLTFIVNMYDTNGNMAMHYAVSHGNFDVVSILLDSKVNLVQFLIIMSKNLLYRSVTSTKLTTQVTHASCLYPSPS